MNNLETILLFTFSIKATVNGTVETLQMFEDSFVRLFIFKLRKMETKLTIETLSTIF